MRRGLTWLLSTGLVMGAPAAGLAAMEVTVSEVVQSASKLEGEEITVEGELIGDYGFRADGWMWTQLNGDAYVSEPIREGGSPVGGNTGIGIRMPTALGEDLDPPGRYRSRGPIVRVTGIWRYHDPERQGESYLEALSLVVIEPGRSLDEGLDWLTAAIGGLLVAATAATWAVTRPGILTYPRR